MNEVQIWNEAGLKYCKDCSKYLEKENFYNIHGNTYSTLCKGHSNQRRKINRRNNYKKKITGFQKLDETIRDKIIEDIKNKIKYRKISNKYNINYHTLMNWLQTKQISVPEYSGTESILNHFLPIP